jgi:hypothetical protein
MMEAVPSLAESPFDRDLHADGNLYMDRKSRGHNAPYVPNNRTLFSAADSRRYCACSLIVTICQGGILRNQGLGTYGACVQSGCAVFCGWTAHILSLSRWASTFRIRNGLRSIQTIWTIFNHPVFTFRTLLATSHWGAGATWLQTLESSPPTTTPGTSIYIFRLKM